MVRGCIGKHTERRGTNTNLLFSVGNPYLDGISSGDTMGDTEGGVVMDSLDSVIFTISDSFIREFTTVSL